MSIVKYRILTISFDNELHQILLPLSHQTIIDTSWNRYYGAVQKRTKRSRGLERKGTGVGCAVKTMLMTFRQTLNSPERS